MTMTNGENPSPQEELPGDPTIEMLPIPNNASAMQEQSAPIDVVDKQINAPTASSTDRRKLLGAIAATAALVAGGMHLFGSSSERTDQINRSDVAPIGADPANGSVIEKLPDPSDHVIELRPSGSEKYVDDGFYNAETREITTDFAVPLAGANISELLARFEHNYNLAVYTGDTGYIEIMNYDVESDYNMSGLIEYYGTSFDADRNINQLIKGFELDFADGGRFAISIPIEEMASGDVTDLAYDAQWIIEDNGGGKVVHSSPVTASFEKNQNDTYSLLSFSITESITFE